MTRSEIAENSGLKPTRVHYFTNRGLLRPARNSKIEEVSGKGNVRYYSVEDLAMALILNELSEVFGLRGRELETVAVRIYDKLLYGMVKEDSEYTIFDGGYFTAIIKIGASYRKAVSIMVLKGDRHGQKTNAAKG